MEREEDAVNTSRYVSRTVYTVLHTVEIAYQVGIRNYNSKLINVITQIIVIL